MKIEIRTPAQLKIMRKAGDILRMAQEAMKKKAIPGTSLKELNAIADDIIRSEGGVPNFFGFYGFPASICTMINADVVHGIPDDRKLKKGDLLSIDAGVEYQGWHSDAAFSLVVGGPEANKRREKFQSTVKEALLAGCEAARDGNTLGDIGHAVESVIKKSPYSVCKEYTGHGIGREMHESPYVFNYGNPHTGAKLRSGMTFCIEPIIAEGNPEVQTMSDGWLVRTVDGKDGCQWEHCGVITPQGLEIFA